MSRKSRRQSDLPKGKTAIQPRGTSAPPPQAQQGRAVAVSQSMAMFHSGPLPPPQQLAQYNETVPNGGERIFKVFEEQSAHRRYLERIPSEITCPALAGFCRLPCPSSGSLPTPPRDRRHGGRKAAGRPRCSKPGPPRVAAAPAGPRTTPSGAGRTPRPSAAMGSWPAAAAGCRRGSRTAAAPGARWYPQQRKLVRPPPLGERQQERGAVGHRPCNRPAKACVRA